MRAAIRPIRAGWERLSGRRRPGRMGLGTATLLALAFGAATGLLELGLLAARVHLFERGAFLRSRQFVWMVPVSDMILFGVVGLVLAVVARWWPRPGRGLAVFAMLALGALSLLLLVRGLHAGGAAILATGLALNATPLMLRRWPAVLRLARWVVPAALAVVALLTAGSLGRAALSRSRALAALPGPPPDAPNVVLIVLDTVRANRLSLQGYTRETTPNLARLATARGVRFDRAYTAAPWTLPAHASLFTARWPHELATERHGRLDETYPTLAGFLRDRGYATVGAVANQFFCGHESGLARGFIDYYDFPVTPGAVLRSSTLGWLADRSIARVRNELVARLWPGSPIHPVLSFQRKDAAHVNAEFLGWLSRRDDQRPFFAFLNYFDAHDPYLLPEGRQHRRLGRVPATRAELTLLRDWADATRGAVRPEDVQLASDAYDDCLAYLDQQVGDLIAAIERRGLLNQTLVIVTSDHGEEFGEHGLFRHAVSLYEAEVHVPLVFLGGGMKPARRVVSEPISLRDVPATVMDLLGFSAKSPFPGSSLAPLWAEADVSARPGEPPLFEIVPTFEPDRIGPAHAPAPQVTRGLVEGRLSYILHDDDREELFDLDRDPSQSDNLAAQPAARADLERLRQSLTRLTAEGETQAPR